jgi:hypothetical protein
MSAALHRWLNGIKGQSAYNKRDDHADQFWKVGFEQSDLRGGFASDGANFEIMGPIGATLKPLGLCRAEAHDANAVEDIRWGLFRGHGGEHRRTGRNYIKRFAPAPANQGRTRYDDS